MDTDNIISIIIISMIIISICIISIISIIIIISIISIVYYNNNLCDLVFKNMLQLRSVSLWFCQFYIENDIFLRDSVLLQKKVIVPLSSVVFCQKSLCFSTIFVALFKSRDFYLRGCWLRFSLRCIETPGIYKPFSQLLIASTPLQRDARDLSVPKSSFIFACFSEFLS